MSWSLNQHLCIQDNFLSIFKKQGKNVFRRVLSEFMKMCYEKNDYFRAQEVYENIHSRGIPLTNQTKRTYVTLLYNHKHYSKICDIFYTINHEKRHEDYLIGE